MKKAILDFQISFHFSSIFLFKILLSTSSDTMSFPKSKVSLSEDEALARKLQEEEEEEEEDRVSDLFPTQMIEQDEILARMLQEQEDRAYENSKKRKAETQGGDWFNLFRKWSKEADPQQTLTSDRELAQQLQLEEEERNERNDGPSAGSSSSNKDPDKLIKYLDIEDPNPDLHELFLAFDKQFFHNKLAAVEVRYIYKVTSSKAVNIDIMNVSCR